MLGQRRRRLDNATSAQHWGNALCLLGSHQGFGISAKATWTVPQKATRFKSFNSEDEKAMMIKKEKLKEKKETNEYREAATVTFLWRALWRPITGTPERYPYPRHRRCYWQSSLWHSSARARAVVTPSSHPRGVRGPIPARQAWREIHPVARIAPLLDDWRAEMRREMRKLIKEFITAVQPMGSDSIRCQVNRPTGSGVAPSQSPTALLRPVASTGQVLQPYPHQSPLSSVSRGTVVLEGDYMATRVQPFLGSRRFVEILYSGDPLVKSFLDPEPPREFQMSTK